MEKAEKMMKFLLDVISGLLVILVCMIVIYALLFHRDLVIMCLVTKFLVILKEKISQKSIEEE